MTDLEKLRLATVLIPCVTAVMVTTVFCAALIATYVFP